MKFTEFEKMSTSMGQFDIKPEFEKMEWIVMEKVHGANFSFHVTKDQVKPARRRAILNEGESFFCYKDGEFMKTIEQKMRMIYDEIIKRFPEKNIFQVSVYGELFGGEYFVQ